MDPTADIRKVSLAIKQEYLRVVRALEANLDKPREVRLQAFQAAVDKLSTDAMEHFAHIQRREKIHYDFMQEVFPKGYELHFRTYFPADVNPHDCTKDDMFAFILASNFDVFTGKNNVVAEEKDEGFKALLKGMVDLELNRHYTHEPHHPEYEKLTGNECSEQDILEMAIDRLSRNVQFNKGNVDMDRMLKFLPVFFLGDKERKAKLFIDCVHQCSDMVSSCAKEMYFNDHFYAVTPPDDSHV